VGSATGMKS